MNTILVICITVQFIVAAWCRLMLSYVFINERVMNKQKS